MSQGFTKKNVARGMEMTMMRTVADQTINAGAGVYTDVTGLSFPVFNGFDYAFKFYITFRSAATTTGFAASVNGPAGTVDYFTTYQTVANAAGSASWLQRHDVAYDAMVATLSSIAAAADLVVMIEGRYKCTADGVFTARFANELVTNTDIVVQKGSWGYYF